jgi:hypothetical protein
VRGVVAVIVAAHLMKKSTLSLALAFAGLLATSASAQLFTGSDNFDAGTDAKWGYFFRLSGSNGDLTFTNQRLDFTKAAGAGSYVLGWDGDGAGGASRTTASFTTSWVADLTVTNTLSGLTGGDFSTIGFEVAGGAGNYSALMLNANSGGTFLRTEGTGFSAASVATGDVNDVFLRLAWDAGAQTLNSFYSFDGSSYTALSTFNPGSQWTAGSAANGFYFEVLGNSNLAGAISGGSMYADNFAVSAIPEPSTYAALAGLGALGLAFWRRRQARAAVQA